MASRNRAVQFPPTPRHDRGGERLVELGLRVADLEPEEVGRAFTYRERQAALSLADTFALSLAASRGWTLLTGDGRLRDLARLERVTCHGMLWVLDRLHEEASATAQTLHDGLTAIAGHPRCRLPRREINERLELFRRLIEG